MSGELHETLNGVWIDQEPADTGPYGDGDPLDSELACILANNESVLVREHTRHLFWSTGGTFTVESGKTPWDGIVGVSGPSQADIDALPSTPVDERYKGVSWIKNTLRWGPFFIPCDRPGTDGRLYLRKLKVYIRINRVGAGASLAHVVVTKHADPLAIAQGVVLGAATDDVTVTGGHSIVKTFTIDTPDGYAEQIPCRRGSAGTGPYYFGALPIYVWFSASTPSLTVLNASGYETR